MKIVITGGAGFIGGHLTELLLSEGHSVVVIDNFSTGRIENLSAVKDHPNLEIITGDILDLPELAYILSKADLCYHLAAAVGVSLVVNDPVRTIMTNVHGTEAVLNAARRNRTPLIIASTSEVYGKSDKPHFSETDDLLIGPSTHSRWSYACSKLLDEFFGMAFYRDMKLPITVVRLFNTVGPRQSGQYGMVVPRFVRSALAGQPLQVYGDGEQSRCFCHVKDCIRALRGLALNETAIGKVYNIGSTASISILGLAQKVKEVLNSDSEIKFIPYEEAYESGFEDMRRRKPNIEEINKLLGWTPERDLEEIIRDTAESIKAGF